MAKLYNNFQSANLMSFAKSFARLNGQPLDKSEIWYSLAEAQEYAATEAAYVGQILSVINSDKNSVVFYGIQDTNGTLKEVGSTPLGDNLSIEIVDGAIQLKGFGKEYYAYVPAVKDQEGNITTPSNYVLTEGFKAGLEPRVILNGEDLVIAWYEPGSETIEDVAANVESVSKTVDKLDNVLNAEGGLVDQVGNLKNQVGQTAEETGGAATGLYGEIDRIDQKLTEKANTADVERAIAEAVAGADHLKREIVGALPAIGDADPNTIYMIPNGLQEDDNKYYEWILIDGVFEQVGSWEVDLRDYAKASDLTNLTTTVTNLNQTVVSNKAETNKAIQDLNDVVNVLETEVDTKVDKVYYTVPALDENGNPILDGEGNPTTKQVEGTLLSPEDKAKLSALVIDEDGSVGISGTVNASNVEGLGSWITENGTTHIKNLTENNLSTDLKEKINFITSVNNVNFTVTNGNLELKEVAASQVTGLQEVLDSGSRLITNNEINLLQEVANGKYNNFITGVDTAVFAVNDGVLNLVNVPTAALGSLGDFTKLPHAGASSLIDEINNLYNYLTWTDIPQ